MDSLKKLSLSLDTGKPIQLHVLRNTCKVEKGEDLTVFWPPLKKRAADVEELRSAPAKRSKA